MGEPEKGWTMASFEVQVKELEEIVRQLESGELPLERTLVLFERGVALSEECKRQLAAAESRIEVLTHPSKNGPVTTKPFEVEDEE